MAVHHQRETGGDLVSIASPPNQGSGSSSSSDSGAVEGSEARTEVVETRSCSTCGIEFQATVAAVRVAGRDWKLPGPTKCPEHAAEDEARQQVQDAAAAQVERERVERLRSENMERSVPPLYRQAQADERTAAGVAKLIDEWRGSPSLYLTGPTGTGKTYVAAALARRTFENPFTEIAWSTVPLLLERLRQSISRPDLCTDEFHRLCNAPLAVLDDIGKERPSDWVLERLYLIVQYRYEMQLPVICTSEHSLDELADRISEATAGRIAEMVRHRQISVGTENRRTVQA